MAGSFGTNEDEPVSAINVTPLVDVVLVLLVIFLMTAPVIYQSAIKVKLPAAATGEQREKSPLQFTVTRDGNVLWDKDPVDWDSLGRRLAALGAGSQEQTAVISADEATAHGVVIKLMDTLRQAGITKFAMNVESPAKPR